VAKSGGGVISAFSRHFKPSVLKPSDEKTFSHSRNLIPSKFIPAKQKHIHCQTEKV
jgi:hypothetical protein